MTKKSKKKKKLSRKDKQAIIMYVALFFVTNIITGVVTWSFTRANIDAQIQEGLSRAYGDYELSADVSEFLTYYNGPIKEVWQMETEVAGVADLLLAGSTIDDWNEHAGTEQVQYLIESYTSLYDFAVSAGQDLTGETKIYHDQYCAGIRKIINAFQEMYAGGDVDNIYDTLESAFFDFETYSYHMDRLYEEFGLVAVE